MKRPPGDAGGRERVGDAEHERAFGADDDEVDAERVREGHGGITTFGPSAEAARLEGSKAFAKEVMAAASVPTAMAHVCESADEVADALIGDRRDALSVELHLRRVAEVGLTLDWAKPIVVAAFKVLAPA